MLWSVGVLAALCAVVWGRTIGHGFVWDDDFFVVRNPALRSWARLPSFFHEIETMAAPGHARRFSVFRPLRNVSYAADFSVAGLRPWWWHAHNVGIHALNALMLYVLARGLLRAELPAVFAAALFLTHPVQTEVVAWVKCRDDLLAAFFVLAFLLLWFQWVRREPTPWRVGALAAVYLAACLSKEQAVVLAAAPVLCRLWPDTPGPVLPSFARGTRRSVFTAVAVLCLVGLGFVLWRHGVIGRTRQTEYLGGTFAATTLTMVRAGARYAGLVLWPGRLLADYSGMAISRTALDIRVVAAGLALLGLAAAAALARKRVPWVTFGLGWSALFLAPVSNVIPTLQFMAERFLYLPMIGCALAGGALLGAACERKRTVAAVAAGLLVLAASARSIRRVGVWRNSEALFRATVRDAGPEALRPRRNLLAVLVMSGRHAEAIPLARELFDRAEKSPESGARHRAEYARHLGYCLIRSGRADEGLDWLRRATVMDPSYSTPFVDLGANHGTAGRHEEALACFRQASGADRSDADAHYNAGIALQNLGRTDEAEEAFRRAIAFEPATAMAHRSLAALLWGQGHLAEAAEVYRAARKLWPEDPEVRQWLNEAERRLRMPGADRAGVSSGCDPPAALDSSCPQKPAPRCFHRTIAKYTSSPPGAFATRPSRVGADPLSAADSHLLPLAPEDHGRGVVGRTTDGRAAARPHVQPVSSASNRLY
jgi:tetratricopeptide (TPR) repeat protein